MIARPLMAAAFMILLLPVISADHVYSHRFIFDGRLVGSDGLPLPGRTLAFFSEGDDFLEPCREGTQPVTDEYGDFRFCYHKHDLSPAAKVGVRYGNASVERVVDIATRRISVSLREPNETGADAPAWNTTYRISGRAWRPGPILLENVQVYGEAIIGLPVNLTVHFEDGTEQTFRSTTDGYGDYDLVVETAAEPEKLGVTVEARGRRQPVQLDTFYHRTYAPLYVSLVDASSGTDGPAARGPSEEAPGNTRPRLDPVLVVAVAVGLVVAIVLSRRKGA